MFFLQLRRLSQENEFFSKSESNQARFKLSAKFKTKLARLVNKGTEINLSLKQSMTTKTVNTKKPQSKIKKVKMTKTKKGKDKLTKKMDKKMKKTKIKPTKKDDKKGAKKPATKPAPKPSAKNAPKSSRSKSPAGRGAKKSVSPKPKGAGKMGKAKWTFSWYEKHNYITSWKQLEIRIKVLP